MLPQSIVKYAKLRGVSLINYSYANRIATVTMVAGDQGNSINFDLVSQLLAAIRQAHRDEAAVIVLAAQGRFFSVGGDLAAFGAADDMADFIDDLASQLHRVVLELQTSDAIVVAGVQGTAAGAGFSLVGAADVIVAADSAKFTFGYTKVGLSPDGGTSMMVASLGLHRMLRLALLNEVLTAHEAAEMGLVTQVVPAAELEATVEQIAAQLAAGSASAQAATKRLLRGYTHPDAPTSLRAETVAIRSQAGHGDGREGVTAFLEKRRPNFTR